MTLAIGEHSPPGRGGGGGSLSHRGNVKKNLNSTLHNSHTLGSQPPFGCGQVPWHYKLTKKKKRRKTADNFQKSLSFKERTQTFWFTQNLVLGDNSWYHQCPEVHVSQGQRLLCFILSFPSPHSAGVMVSGTGGHHGCGWRWPTWRSPLFPGLCEAGERGIFYRLGAPLQSDCALAFSRSWFPWPAFFSPY